MFAIWRTSQICLQFVSLLIVSGKKLLRVLGFPTGGSAGVFSPFFRKIKTSVLEFRNDTWSIRSDFYSVKVKRKEEYNF